MPWFHVSAATRKKPERGFILVALFVLTDAKQLSNPQLLTPNAQRSSL
jgi:hypothetical protein